jgi:hypothetical protein
MRERTENIKRLIRELGEFAEVSVLEDRAIISLISNIDRAAEVLATTFKVMDRCVGNSFMYRILQEFLFAFVIFVSGLP